MEVRASAAYAQSEVRESRRSSWLKRCVQINLGDGFPDGEVVEGGLFIRNDESDNQVPPTLPSAFVPSEALDIRKPVSKRIQNWLTFFYPLSPPKSSSGQPLINVSPAASTAGSDVESDPIMQHRFSPTPKKSILKKLPKMDFLDDESCGRTMATTTVPLIIDQVMMPVGKKSLVWVETTRVVETYSRDEYNRSAIDYIARALTPTIAMMIKKELNEVKSEMEVHEQSRKHTQFYAVH